MNDINKLIQIRNAIKDRMLGKAIRLLDELIGNEEYRIPVFAHDISKYTKEMAEQVIKSFNQNYDEQSVKDLMQEQNSTISANTKKKLDRYYKQKSLVKQLKEKFSQ